MVLPCLQAARLLGDAAIPINTMLLGASLSNGPSWHAVPRPTVVGIVLSKLLLMPIVALILGAALRSIVRCVQWALPGCFVGIGTGPSPGRNGWYEATSQKRSARGDGSAWGHTR